MKQTIKLKLVSEKHFTDYPSASSIEVYKDRFYIMGDDATAVLVLDRSYNIIDRILIFDDPRPRIPKPEKADLESSAVIDYKGSPHLILFGSGSKENRENAFLVELEGTGKVLPFSFSSFLEKIRKEIKDVNIEGATAFKKKIILSNRANLTHKKNRLIIADHDFFLGENLSYRIITVKIDPEAGIGISSLGYWKEYDWLLFTGSTEDTSTSYDDGRIGDSYIGIIKDFSSKKKKDKIKPDELINLSRALPALKQQKIEGMTVEKTEDRLMLHLVSDNDDGQSSVFAVELSFN